MSDFTIDTSGTVLFDGGTLGLISWEGVGQRSGAFAQGYIEAALKDDPHSELCTGRAGDGMRHRFTDLAPETLAAMLKDCEALAVAHGNATQAETGRTMWRLRQAGEYPAFPPVALYLGDDGKIHQREAN